MVSGDTFNKSWEQWLNRAQRQGRIIMRLTMKYPLTIVAIALATALVTGVVAFQKSKTELRLAAERQSLEILQSRKAGLSRYLKSIQQDLTLMASNKTVHDALTLFSDAWSRLDGDPEKTLQRLYIHDNPHHIGEKEGLDQADDGSGYSLIHGLYHPWFRKFQRERGYYDVFLFDTKGNLIYTVFKELDFATNLMDGPWRSTDLGHAYRTAAFNTYPDFQAFYDFKPYPPSNDDPASFIATPVIDNDDTFIGVLAFQMPTGRINEIMQVSAGMGETGRAYLVGQDLLVRNNTLHSNSSEILKIKKSAEVVNAALEGFSGVKEVINEKGTATLLTFTSINFLGHGWALITEIELAEILAPVTELGRYMIIAGLIIGLIVTLIGMVFAANQSRPLIAMTEVMKRLAERDLDVVIPATGRSDEIGDMEKTLAVFKETSVARQQAEAQLVDAVAELEELNELKNRFMGMAAHDLRSPIGAIRGMTELIMELDLGPEKEREYIALINGVSDQMLELINDLLDVSAIESGKFDLNPQRGCVSDVISSRIELAGFTAKAKGISISTDFGDMPLIEFDQARIAQVIDNLLTNAIKFSPSGSTIAVSTKGHETAIAVAVQDQGQGIAADEIDRVFLAFEKLSTKPTAGEKSTGLGLAIAKQIVEAHGGDIRVDSMHGDGATFTFTLPIENIASEREL